MIVRWGLAELPAVLAELGVQRPLLVASERWDGARRFRRAAHWSEVPSHRIEVPRRRGLAARAWAAAGHRHGEGASSATASRSCRCRRRTPAPSGRRPSACATPDRRMRGGGGGANSRRSSTRWSSRSTCRARDRRHGAERARPLRRGALRRGRNEDGDAWRSRGRRIADALPRVSPRRTTRGARPTCSRGAARAGGRSAPPASASATRWRRRSAAATASRTAR